MNYRKFKRQSNGYISYEIKLRKLNIGQSFGGLKYNHYLCLKLINIAHEKVTKT